MGPIVYATLLNQKESQTHYDTSEIIFLILSRKSVSSTPFPLLLYKKMESSLFPLSLMSYIQYIMKSIQLYFEIYLELGPFSFSLSLPACSKPSASVTQITRLMQRKMKLVISQCIRPHSHMYVFVNLAFILSPQRDSVTTF